MSAYRTHLADEAATRALAARLARYLAPGMVVYLRGDLGAGKTTLVRGVLAELGFDGKVKSPTYTLVELYNLSRLCLYHFDFYRLAHPEEWIDAGFREYFGQECACFVEWPERAGSSLPPADIEIHLGHAVSGRTVELHANSDKGQQCLAQFLSNLPDRIPRPDAMR